MCDRPVLRGTHHRREVVSLTSWVRVQINLTIGTHVHVGSETSLQTPNSKRERTIAHLRIDLRKANA